MNALQASLLPLAAIYGALIRWRNRRYDRCPDAAQRVGLPVISVGNLTVGGTGKTPMVIDLVTRLVGRGERPAILTRGYKGQVEREADEVQELRAATGVPVIVNPDRISGAALARREHDVSVLVLDDGFQHRRIARDFDVVLIDALRPWGGGHVLPAGRLREPLSSLRRADWVVVTRANQAGVDVVEAIRKRVQSLHPDVPIAEVGVVAERIFVRGTVYSVEMLREARVLPVVGLANPRTFTDLVSKLAGVTLPTREYGDHHDYTTSEAAAIASVAKQQAADQVVTTRKDWVKLAPLWPSDAVPLARLDIRLEWQTGEDELESALNRVMEAAR